MIGGVESSLRHIATELRRAGHEVKVFCFQVSPDEPLLMVHDQVEIVRYPCPSVRWPHAQYLHGVATAQRAIPAVLNEFQPDAIWSRSAPVSLGIRRSGYQGPLLHIFCTNTKMNCRGLFLQTHGLPVLRRLMLLGLWPSAYWVSSRLERELARQCKAVAFSENMRSQLLVSFPDAIRQCHLIHPGVDSEVFSPDNGSSYFESIERQYGVSRKEPLVLYVGRLSSAKRLPMLLDAVAASKFTARLVLVGSGPEQERLRSYAGRIGLSGRIIFAGTHNEMLPGFYAMSRVCVLPTTTESFGQVYLESLACGTPVVGFASDGRRVLTATEEIIKDGQTGAVVREVTASALAEKIDWILSLGVEDYAAMSHYARHDVRERFSWQRFVDAALKLSLPPIPAADGGHDHH